MERLPAESPRPEAPGTAILPLMQAFILAGGLATRMRPRTLTIAKAMLEVAGRPFIDWQLEKLRACGIDDIVLCVAHLGEQIEAHVGTGEQFGVQVRYSDEGKTLLGTAGALRVALPMMEAAFLVTYGDSYLPFDYAEPLRVLQAHDDSDGVMSVFPNGGRWDSSNVVIDETRTRVVRYEKGKDDPAFDHIDYGALALRRSVLESLPLGQRAGLEGIQEALAREVRMRAVVAKERFYEIGSPEGLAALDARLGSV
jgi:N-acetyl-alpha-D-muramate 1-phosphate uridylyltransferase